MRLRFLGFVTTLCVACGTSSSSPPASGPSGDAGVDATTGDDQDASIPTGDDASDGAAGQDTTVVAFDKVPVYFTGSDNQRIVDKRVSFPAAGSGSYSKITLHLALTCPTDGCDPWDRFGSFGLVQAAPGADAAAAPVIELARFITPYHVGGAWDYDVTDLRPILAGDVLLRGFIDTWVGPGSQYGGGWVLSVSFEMTAGTPAKQAVAVLPVWSQNATYGDPAKPVSTQVAPQQLALPSGTTSYAVRSFVTGHGQGNADNCGEFCTRLHTITVGTTRHDDHLWRADCATTAVPGQQGTWQYSRAGWCPGADVKPWVFDATADVAGGATASLSYSVDSYENTCRPDAVPEGGTCTGCTLGTGCDYDGANHTEPYFALSTVLIAYQ